MLEDLRDFERRIVARLDELRPLVAEYEELERVAARMGIDGGAAAKPARAPAKRRRAGGTRAMGAERRARILELISERPGISVGELSRELGVDPPPLYRVVRKLQAEGVIEKHGTALRRRAA